MIDPSGAQAAQLAMMHASVALDILRLGYHDGEPQELDNLRQDAISALQQFLGVREPRT